MFNLDFLRRSSLMGTTLLAVPSKSHAFSTNYHTCIAMPTWPRCAPPILFWPWPPYNFLPRSCLTWIFFVDLHWWVPLCLQCPAKAMPFQQIIIHALQCQHDIRCAPPILFWHWPPFICSQVHVELGFSSSILLMGIILCAVPNNLHVYAISTNYHLYIAMPTWYTCTSTPI